MLNPNKWLGPHFTWLHCDNADKCPIQGPSEISTYGIGYLDQNMYDHWAIYANLWI